jgi:hypothetical protein
MEANEHNDFALPVELTLFTASVKNNTVSLNWSTASEVNNFRFDIERSKYNKVWNTLGSVLGHGNSNSINKYSFSDCSPLTGKTLYRIKQVDKSGQVKYYDSLTVSLDTPVEFRLMQNYPNPFNPSTAINFQLPATSQVTLKVYNIIGREITTLINEERPAGSNIVYWNGRDNNGSAVSSGIYFYKLTAGKYVETRKMNLLK